MKKSRILLFAILLNISVLFAQPNLPPEKADSLWSVWEDESLPDTSRIKAIKDYTWEGYLYNQPDSAFYYAQLQYDFSEKRNLKKEMADALNIQGSSFYIRGDYSKAIDYYILSLKIQEGIDNKSGAANTLGNIGNIYYHQGYQDKAIDYLSRSLNIFEEIDDQYGIAISLNNIGGFYSNQADSAMKYFTRSLKIQEEIGNKRGIANTLNNMGAIYKFENEYARAIELYERSLKIKQEIGDQHGTASTLNNIGQIYSEIGDHKKALDFSLRSLQLAQKVGALIEIRDVAQSLSALNKKLGKPKEALEMYELYIETRDNVESENNQKAVIRQEYKYEYEKQAALDSVNHAKEQKLTNAIIAQQKAESEKKDAELKAKINQQYALFGGVGLLLIFGGFMYNRFRVTRRQKIIIEEKERQTQLQNVEINQQKEIVQEKNTEILDSITYAKRLQDAILPPIKLVKEYFEESFILFRPKDIVSGDFYWMETKENLIMFAAADCTGHGVPGAMVSVVCANSLNKSVNELGKTDPAEILNATRELVIETFSKAGSDVKDGMDISLCVLNEGTETLHWAGANNPLWIVRRDQNEIEEIKADKQPIGLYGELKPFTSHSVKINGGDSIYMFSDGYADQFGGERGKKFKSGKFKKLLLEHRHQNMEQQKQALEKAFEDWKGSLEQIDDVCVIGVKLSEKEGNPFTRREMEIIQLLEQGKSSKMIGDELNISKTTVDTHRRRILKKVDAGNVTELLRICKDEKWM